MIRFPYDRHVTCPSTSYFLPAQCRRRLTEPSTADHPRLACVTDRPNRSRRHSLVMVSRTAAPCGAIDVPGQPAVRASDAGHKQGVRTHSARLVAGVHGRLVTPPDQRPGKFNVRDRTGERGPRGSGRNADQEGKPRDRRLSGWGTRDNAELGCPVRSVAAPATSLQDSQRSPACARQTRAVPVPEPDRVERWNPFSR